jgi:hypothetical protein
MIATSSNRISVRSWPRPMRLMLYTIATILTIAIMAAFVAALELVVIKCQAEAGKWPAICSEDGRTILETSSLVVLAAASVWWLLFLARVLAIKEVAPSSERDRQDNEERVDTRIETTQLPLGQVLMSGRVEPMEAGRRHITIQDVDLRFWGSYALRNGWISSGDWIAVVYQRLFGLNYVMVFWKGGDAQIRMVGTGIHVFFLVLAIAAMTFLPGRSPGNPGWLLPACAIMFIVSSAYLFLVTRAKKALHEVTCGVG